MHKISSRHWIGILSIFLNIILVLSFLSGPTSKPALASESPSSEMKAGIEVEGGKAYIYIADENSKKRVVTESAKELDGIYTPLIVLSTDQKRFVYVTAADPYLTDASLWVVNIDGTNKQKIATFPGQQLWNVPFSWSLDDKKIAFITVNSNNQLELWTIGSEGTDKEFVQQQDKGFRPEIFIGQNQTVLNFSEDDKALEYTDRTTTPNQKYSVDLISRKITTSAVTTPAGIKPAALPANYKNILPFSQMDPAWKNDQLRPCTLTIGSSGCVLTSAAMVFRYYGVDTNPKTLNNQMGNAACNFDWNTALKYTNGKVTGGGKQDFSYSLLEQTLNQGYPVLVGFYNTSNPHTVVVTGGSGSNPNNYTIDDPADGSTNKTLQYYIPSKGQPTNINVYKGQASNPDPGIPVGAGSGFGANYQDAYNRRGGAPYIGVPTGYASFYGSTGMTWQPLSGGSKGEAAIFHDEWGGNDHAAIRAYVVSGGIYNRYRSLNGPSSAYGAPTSDEFLNSDGEYQVNFGGGYMTDGPSGFHEHTWPSGCAGAWKRLIYNNTVLESGPSLVSCENYFAFDTDWSVGSAGGGVTNQGIFDNNWAASYSRTENLAGGNYSFIIGSDDGVRLWIDGTLQLDDWNGGAYREGTFQINLAAGSHQFQLDYFQVGGPGRLKFIYNLVNPSYSVGQNSIYSQIFSDAYNRTGGEASWGRATDAVKILDGTPVAWQPLANRAAIYHMEAGNGGADPSLRRSFIVSGDFLDYYNSQGGPQSWLYTPTSDQFTNADGNQQISFYSGYLVKTGNTILAYSWPLTANTWQAEYYNGLDLSGPALVRNEGDPNTLGFGYDWGSYQSPIPDKGLTFNENWSATWTRTYNFGPATYNFTLCGDDGVRLYLDGVAVINQWQHQANTCYQYAKNYFNATQVNLEIDYYQENGASSISFSVDSSHQTATYYVDKSQDLGSAVDSNNVGTLSYALSQALPGDTIYLNTSVIVKGSLPAMQPLVYLLGSCGTGPMYTIDGSDPSASADGLTLLGLNYLYGLNITHFRGKPLNIIGNNNSMACMSIKK